MTKKLAGTQDSPRSLLQQEFPAPTKRKQAIWRMLRGGWVGASVLNEQQVVFFCNWEAGGTASLSVCIYRSVQFSVVLFVPHEEVLRVTA